MDKKINDSCFRETDIRPVELQREQQAAYERDIERLLRQRDQFVEVNCPACGDNSRSPDFEKYTVQFYRCDNCDTLYVTPRPTPEMLDEYLRNSENYAFWSECIFPQSEEVRRTKIFRPRVERVIDICKRLNRTPKVLLEVGAGFGTFCEEMLSIGFFERVIALEPAPILAESCRKRGIEVLEKPVEEASFPHESIDVIVSFEVIEHVFDPSYFVRLCNSMLVPGGCLILTCPNCYGFDFQILGALTSAVDLEHLNYFNPSSLSHLLESHGFEVLELQTPGKLDAELVRNEVLAGQFSLDDQPFLKRVLIDEWERCGIKFQNFLAESVMSSHMWIVAEK